MCLLDKRKSENDVPAQHRLCGAIILAIGGGRPPKEKALYRDCERQSQYRAYKLKRICVPAETAEHKNQLQV